MNKDILLEGKRILIVDDEPDVLDTLADYCEHKFGPNWQKEHGFKVR